MSFPPLHPPSQNSIAPGAPKATSAGSARTRQSAWGLSAQTAGARRGLTPLATNLGGSSVESSARRQGASNSPSINTVSASPFAPSFSSVLNSSNRVNPSRNTSSASSSTPPFTPLQTGSQQQTQNSQLLASPRSRTNTPFATSNLVSSAAASNTASHGGGGGSSGGGGISRPATFSPSLSQQTLSSPITATFDRTSFTLPASTSATSNQTSVSKIVVTQVFLLLGSITEKEGKAKWDSQADAIRKLVESNGMDVFAKYFRRLLVGNSPQIFPGVNRNVENPGNYQLLVQEMERVTQDPEQGKKIAETIDTSEGDIFRDFDLATFMNHFKPDPLAKTLLASAFTQVTRADLRTKAGSILLNNYPFMLQSFSNVHNTEHDVAPSLLATTAFRFLRDLPEASRDGTEKDRIYLTLQSRYARLGIPVPAVIRSAMALTDLLESRHELAKDLQKQGPGITASVEAAKDTLRNYSRIDLDEEQISGAILFMVLTPDWEPYRPGIFVAAARDLLGTAFNWQQVVRGFDRNGLAVTQDQFLVLYSALLPIAQDNQTFDIQALWGGQWEHPATQLSFVLAFASLSPSQLDAKTIPRLRKSYDPDDCLDGPEEAIRFIDEAHRNTMISVDAVIALFDIVWDVEDLADPAGPEDVAAARAVVSARIGYFLCTAAGLPKPWTPTKHSIMAKMMLTFLMRQEENHSFVLHSLWKQDRQWVATRLIETHLEDPIKLPILLEHAQEHGWLEDLCTMMNGFGIDLAALAHRKGYIEIDQWAQEKLERGPSELAMAISKFLVIKAQDELRTARREQPAARTVSLAMKTVHALLVFLEEHMKDRMDELILLERQCVGAYPRLINYGEGFDDLIDINSERGNSLLPTADAEMQELYRKMYNAELDVRSIVEALRDYKTSPELSKQDLFCCMIHGLFDEYVCFNEYPDGPLATTAVLFGGIISYGLISNVTLHVALEMVHEAIREYGPETSMYKFGLQALLNFRNRLQEWPDYCSQLVRIPALQGTEVYELVQQVLRSKRDPLGANGVDVLGDAINLTNGDFDAFLSSDLSVQRFRSVNAAVDGHEEYYEEPEEEVQDKVLFVLNNISEQNISAKTADLSKALDGKYHRWFASYLVEQRAKLQPNYQQLYLNMLNLIGDKKLWVEVLRETYVNVQKVLNAESTMASILERTHMTNLGTWLGSLTIARDKPIRQKDISFIDLLVEGWETQRMILVIPFTCAVLAGGSKSVVFKPPNPWLMEIFSLLLELHELEGTKINQKFAIELMWEKFGLDKHGKGLPKSEVLKNRKEMYQSNLAGPMISDGIDGLEDIGLGGSEKGLRNARFSPAAIASSLPDLENMLSFPPLSGSPAIQARSRQAVQVAVQRAIAEIVAPVVERSVTIATLATAALITKDFARESEEDRVRQAAQKMARALSGSLALVTSKEPLRMSMTNFIRLAQSDVPDQALPEGAILMCVNDNLDTACGVVEKQAEERSIPEIEPHIENMIASRRQHRLDYPTEPYRDAAFSPWSGYIPEPYKQLANGLSPEQMEIYSQFARQARGPANHIQTSSTDSGRQIPDVLQEAFPSMPNLPTPSEPPALPHQAAQQQQQSQGRMLPLQTVAQRPQPQVNGYMDNRTIQDHIQEMIVELSHLSKAAPEQRFKELSRYNNIVDIIGRIQHLIVASSPNHDNIALLTASAVCLGLYGTTNNDLEVEVFTQLLHKLCQISLNTAKEVILLFRNQGDDKILITPVTAALLEVGLMEFGHVDMVLTKAMHQQNVAAIECLSALLDVLLFTDRPVALRADFASSLGAMGQWLAQQPDLAVARDIQSKLKDAGIPEDLDLSLGDQSLIQQNQMQYIFSEWINLCSHPEPSDGMFVAFILQLHQRQLLNSQDEMVLFIRLCIDYSAETLERDEQLTAADPSDMYFTVDALAKLLVLLVKNQGETYGAVKGNKPAYMNSILSLIILVLNNHHVVRGEQFNQRMFFRLFSTILYDWYDFGRVDNNQDKEMILVLAENFLLLEPHYFPAFTYGWLNLISHRVFMPAILKLSDDEGCEPFAKIIECMLSYVGELLRYPTVAGVAKELYKGVLRVLLVLHHDFPEFLAENHYRFCNIIPAHCAQLRNLVLSAYPSSIPELPDPFTSGLKVDRLEEIRKVPTIAGDIVGPLRHGNVKDIIDRSVHGIDISDESIMKVAEAAYISPGEAESSRSSSGIDSVLLHAIVLYIGQTAAPGSGFKTGPAFTPESPQAILMKRLTKELHPEARYYFLNAIVNQLRYPNSHTHYFSYALLHLFGNDHADQQESDVRQQITRVFLERLIVHRPHPWGLIITLLELLKNPTYAFWELPFIKAAPEVKKLFEALFQHINQNPRV